MGHGFTSKKKESNERRPGKASPNRKINTTRGRKGNMSHRRERRVMR